MDLLTAWLIMDVKIEAYKRGCNGGYCFVISELRNDEFSYQSVAQQWCRSNGTQLVDIKNEEIQNSLINFISSAYSQSSSGRYVLTNGKRSSGTWTRLNGNAMGRYQIYCQ